MKEIWASLRRSGWVVVLMVGAVVRLAAVGWHDFPLNDGGMFYVGVNDLLNHGMRWPAYLTYNGGGIPFAYPPVPFYLAAGLVKVFPVSVMEVFRWLPVSVSILTIPVFYGLVKELLRERTALLASLAWVVVPRGFMWEIMGGGLTRSVGMLMALLTIWASLRLGKEGSGWWLGLTAGLLALTGMSHLEWAYFAVTGMVVCGWWLSKDRRQLVEKSVVVGVLALVVSAPWWGWVMAKDGVGPFISFLHAGVNGRNWGWRVLIGVLPFVEDPVTVMTGIMGLLGVLVAVAKRVWWLPMWYVILVVIASRGGLSFISVVTGMAAGVFLVVGFDWLGRYRRSGMLKGGVMVAIVVFGLAFSTGWFGNPDWALGSEAREAMGWITENTRVGGRFLVISGSEESAWAMDPTSEWFPALTGRISVVTPQGREWLPGKAFAGRVEFYKAVKACYERGMGCIEEESGKRGESYEYVYVYKPILDDEDKAAGVRRDLRESGRYYLIFENQGVEVYERAFGK